MRVTDHIPRFVALLFWNPESRRPRLPYRVVLTVVVVLVFGVAFTALLPPFDYHLVAGFGLVRIPAGVPLVVQVLLPVVGTGLLVAAIVVAARWFDRRWASDYGFRFDRQWYRDCLVGVALGAALMTGVFLVELAAGWLRVTGVVVAASGYAFGPWFLTMLVTYGCVGLYEELLVRGYLLTNLAEGLQVGPVGERGGVALASLLTSGLFGLLHLANPGAGAVSTVGITLAGLLFAVSYALTGELGIAVGLHAAWNTFQGLVYGFPVSGLDPTVSVVGVEVTGPELATGGDFGPEAGLVGIAAILGGTLAVVAYARVTGRGGLDSRVAVPDLRWRE